MRKKNLKIENSHKTLIVAHRHKFCLQNNVARQQCKPCLSDIYNSCIYMHTIYTCTHQHSQYTCKTYLVISVCPYLQCIYNQLIVLDSICVYSGLIYNEFTISILIDNMYSGNWMSIKNNHMTWKMAVTSASKETFQEHLYKILVIGEFGVGSLLFV